LLIEGFLVAYKRCGIDVTNNVKVIPGSDVTLHVLEGLQSCTLYEVKIAAFTSDGKGRYTVPMIVRTGGIEISVFFKSVQYIALDRVTHLKHLMMGSR